MKNWLIGFGAVAIFSVSASAQEMEDLTRPSEADYALVAGQVQPIFDNLITGEADAVIDAAFPSNSPLYANVQPQLPNLKSQVGVMLDMYGPVSSCERARRGFQGSLLIRMQYLCQHERFVTQWNITMIKTSTGWTLGLIQFADAK